MDVGGKALVDAKDFLDDVKELVEARGTSELLSANLQMVVNKLQASLKELECREVGRWTHNTPRDNSKREAEASPMVQESDDHTWHCYIRDSRPVPSRTGRTSSPSSKGRWKWKSEKINIISKAKKTLSTAWR
ncbi:hypothetical protein MPTK1_4g15470 [Marchantia polymorpha subsp. ruderalis]|uniref:Uncharacterized protein n=2 Tax=Marchantia polymorpha TaxID=3197 RepID=A0AAF6BA75_MARPO|nr:hypothetical protein MARPO_0054s0012 [Marchantia polymorpha]BBN08909.1 hypothetical protein Mp_4g15470 [Marchantia polymorpha subsp. ruderalis]|eukprot:PTQ37895.1 hypothetical protein MARPO_0054s0012 [Marchantia polymorpha]